MLVQGGGTLDKAPRPQYNNNNNNEKEVSDVVEGCGDATTKVDGNSNLVQEEQQYSDR